MKFEWEILIYKLFCLIAICRMCKQYIDDDAIGSQEQQKPAVVDVPNIQVVEPCEETVPQVSKTNSQEGLFFIKLQKNTRKEITLLQLLIKYLSTQLSLDETV